MQLSHQTCIGEQTKHARGSLQLRHNGRDSVSNHRRLDCLLNRLFRHRSKKTSKPRGTGLPLNAKIHVIFSVQRWSNMWLKCKISGTEVFGCQFYTGPLCHLNNQSPHSHEHRMTVQMTTFIVAVGCCGWDVIGSCDVVVLSDKVTNYQDHKENKNAHTNVKWTGDVDRRDNDIRIQIWYVKKKTI